LLFSGAKFAAVNFWQATVGHAVRGVWRAGNGNKRRRAGVELLFLSMSCRHLGNKQGALGIIIR